VVRFVIKLLFYGFLVLLGVNTVVFLLFNVLPGDPARLMLGQFAEQDAIDKINKELGRDKPIPVQFLMYMNDLSPLSVYNTENTESVVYFDEEKYGVCTELVSFTSSATLVLKFPYLRRSYVTNRKVFDIIVDAFPETALLATSAISFAAFWGIIIGVLSAVYRNSWFDRLASILSVFGMALPSFFMGLLLAWVFAYLLRDYTGLELVGSLFVTDDFGEEHLQLKNLILPTVTLGIRPLSIIIQLMRNSLLEELSSDYIRTARAKGLQEYVVIIKHGMKNALNPVITAISGWFAGLMAGAVFVEVVFDWKGIGYEVVDALNKNDLPVVMGTTLMFAMVFVAINIGVDIVYGILDPRIRYE
jgi:peptide/nickel transport system permease protein